MSDNPMNCPQCNNEMIGVEYYGTDPEHYDGISEWRCLPCDIRIGRWSGKRLIGNEQEPRYGKQ